MAYEQALQAFSGIAAADLSALQYTFVIVDSAGKIAANTTAGGWVAGVLQNKPVAGATAQVAFSGVSKLSLGATITADDQIMSTTAGAGDVAVGAASPGNFAAGQAIIGGASGEIGSVLLGGPSGYINT